MFVHFFVPLWHNWNTLCRVFINLSQIYTVDWTHGFHSQTLHSESIHLIHVFILLRGNTKHTWASNLPPWGKVVLFQPWTILCTWHWNTDQLLSWADIAANWFDPEGSHFCREVCMAGCYFETKPCVYERENRGGSIVSRPVQISLHSLVCNYQIYIYIHKYNHVEFRKQIPSRGMKLILHSCKGEWE